MRMFRGLAVAVAVFAAAGPVFAQETGSLIKHRVAQIDGRGVDGARATMEAFAACVVSRAGGRALNLAKSPMDSPRYQQLFRNLIDRENEVCLSDGQLSFGGTLFRGSLLHALYEREFKGRGPTDFSAVTDTGYRKIYSEPLSNVARSAIALEQFGECVARADAAGVQAFLRQRPGTTGEKNAIAALMPKFGGCIPKDEKITFSASILKGALAEGLFWLSMATRSTAGAMQ